MGHHEIIKVIIIPKRHEEGHATDQHALHASNVWQHIEKGVAISSYHQLVRIHLDCDVYLDIVVFFIRNNREWL